MLGRPQHCVTLQQSCVCGLVRIFPLPYNCCPLLPVGCKTAMSLRTGSGLWTFRQSMCVSYQQATVPLAWTHSASAGRTGCLVLCVGVFSPQLLILQFPLYLENQRSWTGSVSASLVSSCWHCCFSHNTVPRECEPVCLLRAKPRGLFSTVTAHC